MRRAAVTILVALALTATANAQGSKLQCRKLGGRWCTPGDVYRAMGWVKHRGEWLPGAAVDALKRGAQAAREAKKAEKEVTEAKERLARFEEIARRIPLELISTQHEIDAVSALLPGAEQDESHARYYYALNVAEDSEREAAALTSQGRKDLADDELVLKRLDEQDAPEAEAEPESP